MPTLVSTVWALLSIVVAGVCSFSFLQPFWLVRQRPAAISLGMYGYCLWDSRFQVGLWFILRILALVVFVTDIDDHGASNCQVVRSVDTVICCAVCISCWCVCVVILCRPLYHVSFLYNISVSTCSNVFVEWPVHAVCCILTLLVTTCQGFAQHNVYSSFYLLLESSSGFFPSSL